MLPGGMTQQFQVPDMDSLGAMSTPKQSNTMKRQYSSNGKNYCDLCNKEVCNKYFLRTHMLKMHGIVIDENKTVIANIDTLEKERMGTLSFRCDICHTEHKSRHLLRQHKQDVHGVVPLSTPSTRTVVNGDEKVEKCPLCERRLAANALSAHIQNEHTGSGGLSLSQLAPTSPSLDFLRCMRCQYTTRDPRNLEMHVERHERMNEATRESCSEISTDAALRATTEAALKMMVANRVSTSNSLNFNVILSRRRPISGLDDASTSAHFLVLSLFDYLKNRLKYGLQSVVIDG
ncbi:unnamed protein product [Angiostrongylus costaricensis]|uniref:C2H2-type domain-containing protein n=1 Tax=Angiostrongylus costaricensis TaxID=334426 RepID=A0A0R3PP53_ANGCS|nr:unnamed protein product [Angiostrongylus costaricensis]